MIISDNDLNDLGQFVIEELAKELIKQEHEATGKLIDSLDYNTINNNQTASVLITMLDYGKYVNTGRKRGAAKVPIQALVDWIKQKGIESNDKKALGIAFAIQKSIDKKGTPAKPYVKWKRGNGLKRVEFVPDTIERIEDIIYKKIEQMAVKQVNVSIDNLVRRI